MGKFGLNLLALILVFGPSNALAQRGNIVNYRCVGLVNDVGFDLSGEISLSVTISSGVPSFAPNARYVECNFTPSLQREL